MNLSTLFSLFRSGTVADEVRGTNLRLEQYARYLRSYQGYSVRGILNTNVVQDWKRIKFNFTQPIINLSAGWLAAKPLDWTVEGDPAATAAAYAIWDRSGSDACFMESALLCGIYGDILGIATSDEEGARLEFIDPSICSPTFDGSDYSKLASVEIAYEEPGQDGEYQLRREMWGARQMDAFVGEKMVDQMRYDRLPACWIRNSSIKGQRYGVSDVEPVLELVEEYDHLCAKQTRIVDYYASPNIVFEGVNKGTSDTSKGVGTIYYVPAGGKVYFLEWAGSGPEIEQHLNRMRNAISQISQVPAIAFGQSDTGLTTLSGAALKILYGPLVNKTHRKQASWGPSLEYLMWLCLQQEGFQCARSAVNVLFPNATPVDGQAAIAEASGKVAARISSRRTVMQDLGIEKPDLELLRIVLEEQALELVSTRSDLQQDTGRAASLGSRGRFVTELPDEQAPAGSAGADFIARFDALLKSESASALNAPDKMEGY